MVRILLTYGANPNAINPQYGRSPLHIAVEEGNIESIKLLISFGADLDLEDAKGDRAVSLARTDEVGFILKGDYG